eukprot:3445710-Pleurochrysis_carterae.AAC.2
MDASGSTHKLKSIDGSHHSHRTVYLNAFRHRQQQGACITRRRAYLHPTLPAVCWIGWLLVRASTQAQHQCHVFAATADAR